MVPAQHPVLALLRERIASGSRPGQRADPFKLGLALEGGGMRGVVSCAMAAEIANLGGTDAFDTVYGTSAGAFAGGFFVARRMELGPPMYYEDLNNSAFIAWRRLLLRRPVLNLEYLVSHGLRRLHPLNWRHVAFSDIPLKIVAASLNEGRQKIIERFETEEDLLLGLRASATLPYLAGPPVAYHGDLLFDGGLFEPLPYPSAVADGCTHVLVLCSRPRGNYCHAPSLLERNLIEPRLRRLSPATADRFLVIKEKYTEAVQTLERATAKPAKAEPYLCGIQLSGHFKEIARLEKDRPRLLAGAAAGARALRQALLPLANPAPIARYGT